jgi:phosphatidylglycerophosphate synthase
LPQVKFGVLSLLSFRAGHNERLPSLKVSFIHLQNILKKQAERVSVNKTFSPKTESGIGISLSASILIDRANDMVRTAVILAPDNKGLTAVFGIPLIRRLVIITSQLGIESLEIIGRTDPLIPVLSDLVPPQAFHRLEESDPPDGAVSKVSLAAGERILVLRADLLIDRATLRRFIVSGERCETSGGLQGRRPLDDDIALVNAPELASIVHALWFAGGTDLKPLAETGSCQGPNDLPCVIATQEHAKLAEAKLVRAMAAQTESDDGFMARHFDRRISRFFSMRLAHTRVTPNHITLGGAGIGMIGACLLSQAGYWSHLVGALLFLFCVIVDGVDGEVARLKLQESAFGHYLDVVTDNIVHVAVFVGIAVGLYQASGHGIYLRALWLMLGGFGLCAILVYLCILRRSPDDLKQSPRSVRLLALLSNRDFAYLVAALAVIDRLNWFLLGAAAGTYLFAASLLTISFYEKRAVAHPAARS